MFNGGATSEGLTRGTRVCASDATVTAVERICHEHVRIAFAHDAFPPSWPGQFLQIRCSDPPRPRAARGAGTAGADPLGRGVELNTPLLRRPFSIADRVDHRDGESTLAIISRAIGVGTRWLDRLSPGDVLNITGPLGRGFVLPESSEASIVLAGGGVGIPPLLYLARVLAQHGHWHTTAVFGATSATLFPIARHAAPADDGTSRPCLDIPGAGGVPSIVTTDDGTLGLRGRVTDGLAAWARGQDAATLSRATVYACGPEPMLDAVADWTRARGVACQLCIERMMGCGFGTCLSCVARVVDRKRPHGWRWALSCSEGPVFDRDRLWHDMAVTGAAGPRGADDRCGATG